MPRFSLAFYEERHLYTTSSYQAFKTNVLAYGNYFAVEDMIADLNASEAAVANLLAAMDAALALLVVPRGYRAARPDVRADERAEFDARTRRLRSRRFKPPWQAVPAVLLSDDVDQAAVDQTLASVLAFPDRCLFCSPTKIVWQANSTPRGRIAASATAKRFY
ncbi:MAG: hypothetical protein MZU97_21440 [Bacillus subtilis]|nr:hypothetical protein [Bacillus subtilis]